ncbi:DUF2716 domain-containing protein [Pseudobacteriovorax antillogorgiicola]|uniref:Uncharacterized protein n=1 Tax=Pseudobacteriovorax antillogorgiicola TaxID=1513793 RepID=A0A1Y6BKP5_9BACT|nr:DUF2716 domain-containing protein [Pseudobacteriovorax antillogorgiicola]TCS55281.1 uncharacterized protein DUF2716 [Pseudobacteriovorax antillogorgiicola]SMF14831.1 Protein of unknown function [Pseudobacteriovorax antillogorgiicola]
MGNTAWVPLSDEEDKQVWNRFKSDFKFNPSVEEFPGIVEPQESVTYSWDVFQSFTNEELLKLAKILATDSGWIYGLDWQHECFQFFPAKAQFDDPWKVSFPDGDYAIIIDKNLKNGYFGHPWEQTICFFGEACLDWLEQQTLDKELVIRSHSNSSSSYKDRLDY